MPTLTILLKELTILKELTLKELTLLKDLTLLRDLMSLMLMARDGFCAMLLETFSISTGSVIRSVRSRDSRDFQG